MYYNVELMPMKYVFLVCLLLQSLYLLSMNKNSEETLLKKAATSMQLANEAKHPVRALENLNFLANVYSYLSNDAARVTVFKQILELIDSLFKWKAKNKSVTRAQLDKAVSILLLSPEDRKALNTALEQHGKPTSRVLEMVPSLATTNPFDDWEVHTDDPTPAASSSNPT